MSLSRNNQTPSHSSFLAWALIISLALHAAGLLYRIASLGSPEMSTAEEKALPIEVSEATPEMLQQEQAIPPAKKVEEVKQEIAASEKADNDKIDPNAKFLGEKNQVVEKQTRAKRIDDFRDKQGTGAKGQEQQKNAYIPPTGENEGEDKSEDVAEDGLGGAQSKQAKGVKRDWKTLSLKDLSVGGDGGAEAATDDRLSGVDDGDRTILSTREFRFYSYYNRIKELLRQYWKPNVERKLAKMWVRGKSINEGEMTTKVLVLLDENGMLQKISRIESSGIDEVDAAAIEAFQKAGPFPNPPKGMLDSDGYVRVHWDFILKTEAAPRIQFRAGGAGGPNGPP